MGHSSTEANVTRILEVLESAFKAEGYGRA
jgi:hypothetical protein